MVNISLRALGAPFIFRLLLGDLGALRNSLIGTPVKLSFESSLEMRGFSCSLPCLDRISLRSGADNRYAADFRWFCDGSASRFCRRRLRRRGEVLLDRFESSGPGQLTCFSECLNIAGGKAVCTIKSIVPSGYEGIMKP